MVNSEYNSHGFSNYETWLAKEKFDDEFKELAKDYNENDYDFLFEDIEDLLFDLFFFELPSDKKYTNDFLAYVLSQINVEELTSYYLRKEY